MLITPYKVASSWLGHKELPGVATDPLVLAMLRMDGNTWVTDDETAWCSAFMNFICKQLGLPRSKHLAAMSWLSVGLPIGLEDAQVNGDIVILHRGTGPKPNVTPFMVPGYNGTYLPGHVAWFAGRNTAAHTVDLLGGNQGDQVSVAPFDAARVVGVRRLAA